jgi:putative nucleotidyltransferase with HDIG domain
MTTRSPDADTNIVDALGVPEYRARILRLLGLRLLARSLNSVHDIRGSSTTGGETAAVEMLDMIAAALNREAAGESTLIILFTPTAKDSYIAGSSCESSGQEIRSRILMINRLLHSGSFSALVGCSTVRDIPEATPEESEALANTLMSPIHVGEKLGGVVAITSPGSSEQGPIDEPKVTLAAALLGSALQQIVTETQNDMRLTSLTHALSAALDARDPKTSGHSNRVAMYAMAIVNEMDCDGVEWSSREMRNRIRVAALLHDIGKVGIPDSILLKDDSLTDEEYDCIKTHPVVGAEILTACYGLKAVVPGVLYHHEHFDGTGYPFGLSGEKIPLMARVIAVADAFDAITSDRPFRKASSHDEGIEILTGEYFKFYDRAVIEALVRAHEKGTLRFVKLPLEAKATDASSYDNVDKIYGRTLKSIPSLPHVLNTVNTLLDDPATSLQQIGKVLATDEGLASRVLRLVNSAYYGLPRMVSTIPLAMTILGAKAIRSHVINIAYSDLMCNLAGKSEEYGLLWRHALTTGSWARIIASRAGDVDPEEAFTAGLIHDIGQALSLRFRPDSYGKIVAEAYKSGNPLVGVEKEVVGFDHTQIGAWAASRWKLPQPLVNAIAWHHDPGQVDRDADDTYRLVRVIHLADIAARATHTPLPFTRFLLVEISPLVLRELGSEYLIKLESMQDQVKEIEMELEEMLGQTATCTQ